MEYLLPFCRNARDASAFKDCCFQKWSVEIHTSLHPSRLVWKCRPHSRQKDGYQYSLILLLYSSTGEQPICFNLISSLLQKDLKEFESV